VIMNPKVLVNDLIEIFRRHRWLTVAFLFVFGVIEARTSSTTRQATDRPMQVQAGRSARQFALTNYESVPLADCTVAAIDGDHEWTVALLPIAPSATIYLPWSVFKSQGQPLPGYLDIKTFRLRCVVGNDWKTSRIGF